MAKYSFKFMCLCCCLQNDTFQFIELDKFAMEESLALSYMNVNMPTNGFACKMKPLNIINLPSVCDILLSHKSLYHSPSMHVKHNSCIKTNIWFRLFGRTQR